MMVFRARRPGREKFFVRSSLSSVASRQQLALRGPGRHGTLRGVKLRSAMSSSQQNRKRIQEAGGNSPQVAQNAEQAGPCHELVNL